MAVGFNSVFKGLKWSGTVLFIVSHATGVLCVVCIHSFDLFVQVVTICLFFKIR